MKQEIVTIGDLGGWGARPIRPTFFAPEMLDMHPQQLRGIVRTIDPTGAQLRALGRARGIGDLLSDAVDWIITPDDAGSPPAASDTPSAEDHPDAPPPPASSAQADVWTMAVSDVQTDLNTLGYGPLKVDGIKGPMTYAAVRAFQGDQGLTVDGSVGPDTTNALNNALSGPSTPVVVPDAPVSPSTPDEPGPSPEPSSGVSPIVWALGAIAVGGAAYLLLKKKKGSRALSHA